MGLLTVSQDGHLFHQYPQANDPTLLRTYWQELWTYVPSTRTLKDKKPTFSSNPEPSCYEYSVLFDLLQSVGQHHSGQNTTYKNDQSNEQTQPQDIKLTLFTLLIFHLRIISR